jgi:hypothetical protein
VANRLCIRILAAIINDTDGKFDTGVFDMHRWQIKATLIGCLHLTVNFKKNFYLYVNSTTQKCPKKPFETFVVQEFFFIFPIVNNTGGAP